MMIIAPIALDYRSLSISAGVAKATLHLLLPDIPWTSNFWIGNKWYSKFWLVPSAGFEEIMELIPPNFFFDLFLKPP